MGIKGLTKLLKRYAPKSMKETNINQYNNRTIAIDASILLYQFISAVRDKDGHTLVDEYGETTSHIIGTFYRTIKFLDKGIKPLFVFDGKPPEIKSVEIQKRNENAKNAKEELDKAVEEGDEEKAKKMMKRTARMSKEQSDEVKKLLELMGIPYVEAEGEAEATCAILVKEGICDATATEDMDALTLGSLSVVRKFTPKEDKKNPIIEYSLDKILSELEFTIDQFIDLCIMLGCDYCETIKGIGPIKSFELITEYKSIEEIIKHLDGTKYEIPENWNFAEAREMFKNPIASPDLKKVKYEWKSMNEEGLKKYLIEDKHFNEQRVCEKIEKLKTIRGKKQQKSIKDFFKVKKVEVVDKSKADQKQTQQKGGIKRKAPAGNAKLKKKK